MKSRIKVKFENKIVSIKESDILFEKKLTPNKEFVSKALRLLWFDKSASGFLIFSDLYRTLLKLGHSKSKSKEMTNEFRKKLVDDLFTLLMNKIPKIINPFNIVLKPYEFEVEGYNINLNFQDSGIDFYSTKQLHFDIVEPISSNLYGINKNIEGGLPVFANCQLYCQDNKLDILTIIDKIPGNRIITVKKEHYLAVLEDYAFAYEVDMDNDMPFSVYLNRVREVGILHGATTPVPINIKEPSERPLIHYSYDNHEVETTKIWYKILNLSHERLEGNPSLPKPIKPIDFKKKKLE